MSQQNPYYVPPSREPKVRFSRFEVRHLAVAVAALTLAFAFVLPERSGGISDALAALTNPFLLLASFIAVSSGFVLHELAHKFVAQHYGHWAEFRAQFSSLGISTLIAFAFGILFAAPGAVMIRGHVTPKENGIISLVGPGTNFVIAGITFPFGFSVNPSAPLPAIMATVSFVNALLAVFNLIPAGPLDGKKVWRWNKPAYLGSMAAAIALFVAAWYWLQPFARW